MTPEGRIRVVGYNDMDEMMGTLAARFEELYPALGLDLDLRSTRSGPPALSDGSSAFAPMGAEFTEADRIVFRARWNSEPVPIRIAHASLKPGAISSPTAIFVHRSNPLQRISLTAARQIFVRGAKAPLRDWGGLGMRGLAGRAIHPVGMAEGTALGLFLLGGPLSGAGFVADYDGRAQSREVVAAVATDPLAIGLANLSNARPEIRALTIVDERGLAVPPTEEAVRSGRYPLDRHLLIYVRRDPDGQVEPVARSFLALVLSCEGQQIIAGGTRGYLPLNPRELERERKTVGLGG